MTTRTASLSSSNPAASRFFANDPATTSAETFLDLSDAVSFSSGQEIGLLGLAFHPDFTDNGYFYVYHTPPQRGCWRGGRTGARQIPGECRRSQPGRALLPTGIFSFDKNQPQSNHNGGKIAFGLDGYLYVSLGDGGGGVIPRAMPRT